MKAHQPDCRVCCLIIVLFFSQTTLAQNRLPWEPPSNGSEPIVRPPSGPLAVLERLDVGPSQIESFVNGQPLSPGEEDVLIKVLYYLPRLGLDNLERWRQRNAGFDGVAAAPAEHRGQVFRLSGRAKQVERKPLLPEQQELFQFGHYFLVTVDLNDSPYQAIVACRKIPQAWASDTPIDEPTAADAVFLKVGDLAGARQPLMFAAGALGWYPHRRDDSHHIGTPQLALAKLGMDLSLWDDIRDSKDQGLAAADREGFYQLLHMLGKATSPLATGPPPPNVVSLLEKPADHFGEIVEVEGVARRIMRIAVNDADIQSRFGLNHYYEIDMFLPLGDASLHFAKAVKDKSGPTYRNNFPATLVARELPKGLAEGENVHQSIRAEAVFFKTWAYRSPFATQFNQLQPAPLFMTRRPQVVAMQSTANWVTSGLVVLAFSVALAVAGILAWFYRRDDQEAARVARKQTHVRPDFSGLK